MFSFKGSLNKALWACIYIMAHPLLVCPNPEKNEEKATFSSENSKLVAMNDATEFYSSNSSKNDGSNFSHSIALLQELPKDSNITETFDECLKNASQILECIHLLDPVIGNNGHSLGSILQNLCSLTSSESLIGRNGSSKFMGTMSKEFSSDFSEKSVFLKYLASSISAVGIICNLSTIAVILKNTQLRKPFYMCILSLAVADVMFQVNFFLNEFIEIPSNFCESLWFENIFDLTTYTTKMFSSLNVMVLLTLRYAMFVHPLKCRAYLTNRKIYTTSVMCLILSIVYGVIIVKVILSLNLPDLYFLYIADDGLLLFIIVILNIYFALNRCKTMKSSLAARNLEKRMVLMVFLIVLLRTISSLFFIIQSFFEDEIMSNPYKDENFDKGIITRRISHVLKVFIHSINPFIYFFSSKYVINVLLSCFRCLNM